MTRAMIYQNTPETSRGKYAVARQWNSQFIGDFLREWDDEHGASFGPESVAMVFDNKDDATRAAMKAKALVPVIVDPEGKSNLPLVYDPVILS